MQFEDVEYELDGNVAVITLNRPGAANAQSERALLELDEAWRAADEDRDVKVIVMQSNGKHFSAGHDMSGTQPNSIDRDIPRAEAMYDWETRNYFHFAKRWRDIPKPSIAAVQGKCIAAGLMLCWPCDLIVAADNAEFSDPVVAMGICGVEYHAHTWEFGARKAKELLFTGGSLTAQQAEVIGMVNKVVPLDDLRPATMALAHRIAQQDSVALRMAKRAVNNTQDIQGFKSALEACFDMHHWGHSRALVITGDRAGFSSLESMKEAGRQS